MDYRHINITCCQSAKRAGQPCGDVVRVERTPAVTTLVCSDGLGSGIKANLAATMCVSRLHELLRRGYSLREAFSAVAKTMNEARDRDLPYAVFTAVEILNDGATTALNYEMPPPVLVTRHLATAMHQRTHVRDRSVIGEGYCVLDKGEALMVVSDGVTQAGLGRIGLEGWGIESACGFLNTLISQGAPQDTLAKGLHREAHRLWGAKSGDDITAVLAQCREGRTVTVLTGPPHNQQHDRRMVRKLKESSGARIVCGGSSAGMVAKALGTEVIVGEAQSMIEPPPYTIEGVDLVTEGAVTLNQVYNVLEEDSMEYPSGSAVGHMCRLLKEADRITFLVGTARNEGSGDITFRQQGILPRATIVPLIADKLRSRDKLVVVKSF